VFRVQKERAKLLSEAAEHLNSQVFQKNTEKIRSNFKADCRAVKQLKGEERMDCIVLSVSKDGKKGVITGNVKERTDYSKRKMIYGEYGLNDGLHHDTIKSTIKEVVSSDSNQGELGY